MTTALAPKAPGEVDDAEFVARALAEPFDPNELKFKPQVVQGNRALGVAYVDARVVQERLDSVLGIAGWQDEYQVLPDNTVVCTLRCKIGGEWITKSDVGGPSEQPDGGDRMKAAFSDALKRAAVKFGVSRYLYRLPGWWLDYDPKKRQFTQVPELPRAALPSGQRPAAAKQLPPAATPAKPAASAPAHRMPASGGELLDRLMDYENKLVQAGLCQPDELVQFVEDAGEKAGLGRDLSQWQKPGFTLAAQATRAFEDRCRKAAVPTA
jgi:hypothetical protein